MQSKYKRGIGQGWKYESARHSLSAKGVKTGKRLATTGVGLSKINYSEEICPRCKKKSEFPTDWYYNEGTGQVEFRCPKCGKKVDWSKKLSQIDISTKKIKGQTDSFFYDGEIATIKKPNGTILSLIASGDIRININDDSYNNNNISDAIDKYKLTDKRLRQLEKEGKLTWENNNWFEVMWLPKDSDTWESEMGNVAYDYDSAIQLLKSYVEDDNY
jgi:hypothetical protein